MACRADRGSSRIIFVNAFEAGLLIVLVPTRAGGLLLPAPPIAVAQVFDRTSKRRTLYLAAGLNQLSHDHLIPSTVGIEVGIAGPVTRSVEPVVARKAQYSRNETSTAVAWDSIPGSSTARGHEATRRVEEIPCR